MYGDVALRSGDVPWSRVATVVTELILFNYPMQFYYTM
jgi:hypothetical protein